MRARAAVAGCRLDGKGEDRTRSHRNYKNGLIRANRLDTPACHLATMSPTALTAPQCSQRKIATPHDDLGSYQFPSHQLELPVVLMQDSIAGFELVDLEPIPQSIL
jgi:hypothetical protein